jgi:hypothetical protein
VEPGKNPSVVIFPSTETDHKSKDTPLLLNHSKQQQFPQKFLLLQNIVKAKNFQQKLPNQKN